MKQELSYTVDPLDKVPFWRKVAFTLAAPPEPMMMASIANLLVLFYNSVLGVSGTLIGLVLTIPRIVDAVTDPFIGRWSDHHNGPRGRRRPFLLWGGLLAAVTYALLWLPPAGFGPNASLVYLFITANVFYVCAGLYLVPYHALALELSPDYKERTSIMVFRKIGRALGDMTVGAVPLIGVFLAARFGRAGDEVFGYGAVGIVFGIITIALVTAAYFGISERATVPVDRGLSIWRGIAETMRNAAFVRIAVSYLLLLLALYLLAATWSYLFIYYLQDRRLLALNQFYHPLAGMLFAFVWWRVSNRFGKVSAAQFALACIALACLSVPFAFNPEHKFLFLVTSTLIGIGWSGVTVAMFAILADIVDVDELATGQRREGAYSGVHSFISKLGSAGATPLVGIMVDVVGFVPGAGANQNPIVFERMQWIVAAIGGSLVTVAILIMIRFPLSPRECFDVRKELEARRGIVRAAQ